MGPICKESAIAPCLDLRRGWKLLWPCEKSKRSDLKNQISRYLDYVKHGETVLVLDRMVPVAELKPVTVKSSSENLSLWSEKESFDWAAARFPKSFSSEHSAASMRRLWTLY